MADLGSTVDFQARLRRQSRSVSKTLSQLLIDQRMNGDLKTALEYTLGAPGKRVRSVLVLWCCELVAGQINDDAEIASMAIEMVHTYSLVHDDLPAMDDDDMRRGLPTCHKAFDEATAILAGDALLTLAFEILATKVSKPATAVKLIRQLAQDAGADGMIAGQMADLKAEQTYGTLELLEYIHANKTAKMFRCAAAMGAICGRASQKQFDSQFGHSPLLTQGRVQAGLLWPPPGSCSARSPRVFLPSDRTQMLLPQLENAQVLLQLERRDLTTVSLPLDVLVVKEL